MTYLGIPLDGKPNLISSADCQQCGRLDFPVLPVRPSVVDNRHAAALASGTRLYDQTRDTAFGRMKRQGTTPVTRLLRQGYVYVYYQAWGQWDLWRSHDDGTYLKLLELATPEQYAEYVHEFTAEYAPNPAASVCSRGAANVPAGLITLVGPSGQVDIWLAYATHAWDPQVLNDYGAVHSKTRALRMIHLNGQALMAQGVFPPTGGRPARPEHARVLHSGVQPRHVAGRPRLSSLAQGV